MVTVLIQDEGHFVRVELNDPSQKNALSQEMIQELTKFFRGLNGKQHSQWRFVTLEGKGDVFCAGANLVEMKNSIDWDHEENMRRALSLHEMFQAFYECEIPILCRAQGAVFGGALGLVGLSDYVIAEESTIFCFSEVKLGLAPAVISDFLLRKFPPGTLQPYMISGIRFSAGEAQRMQLIHQITGAGRSSEVFKDCINHFLSLGPQSIRVTKKLIKQLSGNIDWGERRQFTTQLIAGLRVSEEGQEGVKSFLEKRKPRWVTTSGE
ncbi:MAG: enoyl-CoA hydratase-related protein [Bdellovibrionaceae bacterium]|nr:enoyl-CoA hydratase-related protein [Pseudobdellovibrionaceae bacterium]MDW8190619.1 enoyl-CoA hydratase-related protein [Pseudobdellovibrionaceae bacterium]